MSTKIFEVISYIFEKKYLFSFFIGLFMISLSNNIYAVDYSTVGSGCVPHDTTIQNNAYTISDSRIKLKPGATRAEFTCPIHSSNSNYWQKFKVSWHDPDGRNTCRKLKMSDLCSADKYRLSAAIYRR